MGFVVALDARPLRPRRRCAARSHCARCSAAAAPHAAGARHARCSRSHGAVKRFGGLVAVNDVSFDVDAGEIVGLIGPNGAGKSTMFNLLTCTLPMTRGSVDFLGHDISALAQREVARLGIARTFQHVKLRPQMSLLDNVALGAHARTSAGVLRAGLAARPRRGAADPRRGVAPARPHRPRRRAPTSSPAACRSARSASSRSRARSPPTRCCWSSTSPPRACAAPRRRRSRELLQRLRDEGVTILIVEHDMDFVMKLVDRLVVMNFGAKLVEGAPAAVRADARVQAAYLGAPHDDGPVRRDARPPRCAAGGRPALGIDRRCSRSATCTSPTARSRRCAASRLALAPGQIVSVIGPNGAGKTTLLAAVMGLLPSRGGCASRATDLRGLDVEARVERGLTPRAGEARAVRRAHRCSTTCCSAPIAQRLRRRRAEAPARRRLRALPAPGRAARAARRARCRAASARCSRSAAR